MKFDFASLPAGERASPPVPLQDLMSNRHLSRVAELARARFDEADRAAACLGRLAQTAQSFQPGFPFGV